VREIKAGILGLAFLASVVACAGQDPGEVAPAEMVPVSGFWTIGQSELFNDCGSEGYLFPIAPAMVRIDQRDGEVVFGSPGEEPRTYAVEGQRWSRERSETIDGCALSLQETWHVHGFNRSRLSATYDGVLDASGQCDIPGLHSCRVRYSVWGGRR